jgi:hypothetical protein
MRLIAMAPISENVRVLFTALFLAVACLGAAAEEADRFAVASADEVLPGKRVALVIGNSAYRHADPLPNPENDARDMAALLRMLGFDVVEGLNLDRTQTEDLVQQFAGKAETAEATLFYYAGHGMQVDGKNYMLPVDARLETKASL